MRKKIAFIKEGPYSHINRSVRAILAQQFPECELQDIDVWEDLLKRHRMVLPLNLFKILNLYGPDIVRGHKTIRDCLFRTPYIFHQIKSLIHERLHHSLAEYAFSIQTQSQ